MSLIYEPAIPKSTPPIFSLIKITHHTDILPALNHPRARYQTTEDLLYCPGLLKLSKLSNPKLTQPPTLPHPFLLRKPQERFWTMLCPSFLCLLVNLIAFLIWSCVNWCAVPPVSKDLWVQNSSFMTIISVSVCLTIPDQNKCRVDFEHIFWEYPII